MIHTLILVLPLATGLFFFCLLDFIFLHFHYFFPCWKPHNQKDIIGCLNFYFWHCSECRQSIVKLFLHFWHPVESCALAMMHFLKDLWQTPCASPWMTWHWKTFFSSFFLYSLINPPPSLYVALCVQCWQFCKVSNKRCWRLRVGLEGTDRVRVGIYVIFSARVEITFAEIRKKPQYRSDSRTVTNL